MGIGSQGGGFQLKEGSGKRGGSNRAPKKAVTGNKFSILWTRGVEDGQGLVEGSAVTGRQV